MATHVNRRSIYGPDPIDRDRKTCYKCKKEKSLEDFPKDNTRADGRSRECKACKARTAREYRIREQEQINARKQLKERGVTEEQYQAMVTLQGNVCAICGTSDTRAGDRRCARWTIDHDHDTGLVRGLLCPSCNRGIGQLGDDVDRLRAAIAYLENHQARGTDPWL